VGTGERRTIRGVNHPSFFGRGGCRAVLFSLAAGCANGVQASDPSAATPVSGDYESFNGNGDPVAPGTTVQASVTYPFLIADPKGGPDYFPTAFAHLLGQALGWTDISTSLACFTLTNPSDAPMDATLRVDLMGYSTPIEQSVTVPAYYTVKPCLNPTPALSALYALSAPVPGQVHATVTSEGSTAPVLDDVHPVAITTGQTVFNGKETNGEYQALYKYQAVLSMPKDPWVQALLAPAARRSAWGTFGAGGYGMHLDANNKPIARNPVTVAIASGASHSDSVYFTAGESVTLTLDSVTCGACDSRTIDFFAIQQQTVTAPSLSLDAPQAVMSAPESGSGQEFTITAPTEGQYQLMFSNTSSDAESVTYHRTGTQADTVIDTLQAVYEEVQSFGITYESIASSYFDPFAAQSVRWPSTVMADLAANCIDGSMLFASIIEALQLEPVVVFIPGHAFMGVRQGPSAQLLWPVETTMLGTAPFANALSEAMTEYGDTAVPPIAEMDIKAARLAGLLPIPE
jgi:hypothetical protein